MRKVKRMYECFKGGEETEAWIANLGHDILRMRSQMLGELIYTPSWLHNGIESVLLFSTGRAYFLIESPRGFWLHGEK